MAMIFCFKCRACIVAETYFAPIAHGFTTLRSHYRVTALGHLSVALTQTLFYGANPTRNQSLT